MGVGTFVKVPSQNNTSAAARHGSPIRGDLVLLGTVIVLSLLGLLMVDSASPDYSVVHLKAAPLLLFYKQLLWFAIGTAIAVFVARLDYHVWQRVAVPLIIIVVALLVAVLFKKQSGDDPLRSFFGGSVQPSELAKLGIVIYLSVWLYAKRDALHDIQLGLIPLAAILGVVGGLILIQPDLSAGATVFILGGLLFFLAGGEIRQIVLFILVAAIAGWIVMQLDAKGSARLASYVAGLRNPLESNYQVRRSLEAVVRGGWFGVGLGNSITKLTGLPVPHSDSIFAVLAEELGVIGAVSLIGLYSVLLWRGLRIAQQAPDMLGSVMAAGLTFWIITEAMMNMAFIVGLFPVTGNALPFVSYGGSSLVSTLTAVGILYSISRKTGAKVPESGVKRSYGASTDLRRRDRRRREPRASRP